MFSRDLYDVVHNIGIALVMSSLGGVAMHALIGGTRQENTARRLVVRLHTVGVALILLGGFGMLVRIGFPHRESFPPWVWIKLLLWTSLAAVPLLPYHHPRYAKALLLGLPAAAGLAAFLGIYKPFS